MRILILGNDYSAQKFFELFSSNSRNIVFSTIKEQKNYIEFNTCDDILDFCTANEINLVLIIDESYINMGLSELISSKNISTFSPSIDAISICSSKAFAKRFMHKNKIPSPHFGVFEKPQQALEYLKQCHYPQAIKPDVHNFCERTVFVETKRAAQAAIDKFFTNGNNKILIEDYIDGRNINVWTISDGYNAKIIGTTAKYQDNIAIFEPNFVSDDTKQEIYNQIISPVINALSFQNNEYIGILGFDIMLSFDNVPYLVGFNNFFDDINVDFFTQGFDLDWVSVFESCLVGDIFIKYNFVPETKHMLTLRQNNKIEFISANTKTNLKMYISELGLDLSEFSEAQKLWKFYQ